MLKFWVLRPSACGGHVGWPRVINWSTPHKHPDCFLPSGFSGRVAFGYGSGGLTTCAAPFRPDIIEG